jgi:hypothetical protein
MGSKKGTRKMADVQENAMPEPQTVPSVQPQIQDHIGRQLRAIYEDVLNQPVPDRFEELLEKLDRRAEEKK